MIAMLASGGVAFVVTIGLTPVAIRFFRGHEIGQFIQDEVAHDHKQGTPTMGGLVVILGVVAGFIVGHIDARTASGSWSLRLREFQTPGLLVLLAFVGMGLIGFLDDLAKVTRARNLGLKKRWKFMGQLAIAGLFGWAAVQYGVNTELSFTRPLGFDLGWFYVVWVLLMLTAASNAVNFTDGLDGLASGSGALVFGAFTIVCFWQFRHPEFYEVVGTQELAMLASSLTASTLGFLWWNAAPARIILGDTGAEAIGGAMAALALLTNTHLLLVIFGGLYVMETVSVLLQIISYRGFGRRIFRMAPVHHHYELKGWPETTIIVRFWILAALFVALGLGLFYGDFIMSGGIG
ncbi:MAG: phospho-N-acetylmuramoyl-pentapeptide-transferase [Actinobacteria bacterium RBG_16_68_21]|nr:MAG: phospho-N-acetylmuramoyl-pentapeptide-transferase [Actinobacteria bacterium RBG_16_68_21]